jgi:hypothetical protein
MFAAGSAAVLLAVQEQPVAQFVAMAASGFDGGDYFMPLIGVVDGLQGGGHIVLGIYRQYKGEDDAVSFLTGHVIHPVSGYTGEAERVKEGGDPSPLEEDRHPQCGIAD